MSMDEVRQLEEELKAEELRRTRVLELFEQKKLEEQTVRLRKAQEKTFTQGEREEIQKVFDLFDADKSGQIEGTELREVSKSLGCELTDDEINETLRSIDKDGNRRLDFEEFLQWWGSDQALGGNKGVKLMLLRTRLTARIAKNSALSKLKTVGAGTDISGRTIDFASDVVVGKVPEKNWKPAVEFHHTALPLSQEAFKHEGKKIVKAFQEHSTLPKRDDYWEKGEEGTRLEDKEIQALAKVTFALRPETTRSRAEELIANYNKYINEFKVVFSKEGEPPPVAMLRTLDQKDETGSKLCMDVLITMRYAKVCTPQPNLHRAHPHTHTFTALRPNRRGFRRVPQDERSHVHRGLSAQGVRIACVFIQGISFPSFLPSFLLSFTLLPFPTQNDMDPMTWLMDEESLITNLFSTAQLTCKMTVSRALLDLYQNYIFTVDPGSCRDFYRDIFAKFTMQMIFLSLAGSSSIRIKLRSPADVLDEVGDSFGRHHKAYLQSLLEENEVRPSPKLAEILSGNFVQEHWQEQAKQRLRAMTAKETLGLFRTIVGDMVPEEIIEKVIGPIHEAVLAPTRVQVLTGVGTSTWHLKGCEFMTALFPSSTDEAKRWVVENADILEKLQEKIQQTSANGKLLNELSRGEGIRSSAALQAMGQMGNGPPPRRMMVAGMPGSGKTTLIRRIVTGMGFPDGDPPPTTRLSIHRAVYKGREYPVWEYYGAPSGFVDVESCMLELPSNVPLTMVWVIDGEKGVQPGEREAFFRLQECFEGADKSPDIVVVVGKCDLLTEEQKNDPAYLAGVQNALIDTAAAKQLGDRLTSVFATGREVDSAMGVMHAVRTLERVARGARRAGEGDDGDEEGPEMAQALGVRLRADDSSTEEDNDDSDDDGYFY